jgi:hypothetical protein
VKNQNLTNIVLAGTLGAGLALLAGCTEVGTEAYAAKGGGSNPAPELSYGALIMPRYVETSESGQIKLDSELTLVYSGDYAEMASTTSMRQLARTGTMVHLWVFETGGALPSERLLTNDNGVPICDPCSFELGGGSPMKRTIRLEDLILESNGQFLSQPVAYGYIVVKSSAPIGTIAGHAYVLDRADPFNPVVLVEEQLNRIE